MKPLVSSFIALTLIITSVVGHAENDPYTRDELRNRRELEYRQALDSDVLKFSNMLGLYVAGDSSVTKAQMVEEMLTVNPEILPRKLNAIPSILGETERLTAEQKLRVSQLQNSLNNKAVEMNKSRDGRRTLVKIGMTITGAVVGTATAVVKGANGGGDMPFMGSALFAPVGLVIGLIGGHLAGYGLNALIDQYPGKGNVEIKDLNILNEK